jgi:hypothetical protein
MKMTTSPNDCFFVGSFKLQVLSTMTRRRRRPPIMAFLHFPWSLLIKLVLTGCALQSLWITNQLHSSDTTAASLDDIVTIAATLSDTPIRGSSTTSGQTNLRISPFMNTTIASSSASLTAAATANNNAQHQLKLRFDWTSLSPRSPLAVRMMQHQTNCDLPLGYFRYRNRFGLGSDLHVYSQALCNAIEERVRVHSTTPWNWWDVELCNYTASRDETAMSCYFPASELQCPGDMVRVNMAGAGAFAKNISNARGKVKVRCPEIMAKYTVSQIRAAGTEFLFTHVSKHIQDEATRQLNRVFSSNDQQGVPGDLITVHIRWGDKEQEIKLLGIDSYIQAVEDILMQRKRPLDTANIFLATEDPRALAEFESAAPVGWKIYVDQYFRDLLPHRRDIYNGPNHMALDLQGKPGPAALGSLLVAMEANDFVLTTASNWSRLMNELRGSILDPECGNCTLLVDLKPGEW